MGFFQWVTEGVRKAVVRGIEQAAEELAATGCEADITIRLPNHREPLRLEAEPVATNGRRKSLASAANHR